MSPNKKDFLQWLMDADENGPGNRVVEEGGFEVVTGGTQKKERRWGQREKHLRGRHNQKLHGNRGGMIADRGPESIIADSPMGGDLFGRETHQKVFDDAKAKFVKGGRTWNGERRKFLWAYIEWVKGGKTGMVPKPEDFGDSVPKAANHLRRLVETNSDIKALGVKAPKTPKPKKTTDPKPGGDTKPAPKPEPEPKPVGPRFGDDVSTRIHASVGESFAKRGWSFSEKAKRYASDYIEWIRGGREGPEPIDPPRYGGTAKSIRAIIEKDPEAAKITKPEGKTGGGETGFTKGEKWDSGLKSYDPDSPTRASVIERNRSYIREFIVDRGLDLRLAKEIEDEIIKTVNDTVKNAEMRIGIREKNLISVLREGRYKTQFEVHDSGGTLSPELRSRAEARGLGTPESIDKTLRPVYGYLKGKGIISYDGYGGGRVNIVMKNDVKSRTTLTHGDSLGPFDSGTVFGSKILDNGLEFFPTGRMSSIMNTVKSLTYGRSISASEAKTAVVNTIKEAMKSEIGGGWYSYVEAQFHGGVSVKDFAKIVSTGYIDPELKALADKLGIPIEVG